MSNADIKMTSPEPTVIDERNSHFAHILSFPTTKHFVHWRCSNPLPVSSPLFLALSAFLSFFSSANASISTATDVVLATLLGTASNMNGLVGSAAKHLPIITSAVIKLYQDISLARIGAAPAFRSGLSNEEKLGTCWQLLVFMVDGQGLGRSGGRSEGSSATEGEDEGYFVGDQQDDGEGEGDKIHEDIDGQMEMDKDEKEEMKEQGSVMTPAEAAASYFRRDDGEPLPSMEEMQQSLELLGL